ncbi:UDP-N-acetylmuramoyl-L-alanine--D-glutamate ligase [Buchnera aphidicola]|uniref:UDP-N-acetylmuramoyl-L-alanine--D-glutamate ligase n=1 Tax=Buchnera aphidicola TaxID=9 RepID=UPI003BEEF2EB
MSTNYCEKKILILGMGITGISCMNFFLKKGIIPKMLDESLSPKYLYKIPSAIKYQLGEFKKKWILESDLIIISPGISPFKSILIQARLLGIKIVSDIELFALEAKHPIISITGTNGKSTVSTIIQKIAKNIGYHAVLGGNIGFPVLNMLENKEANLYIIELSSFQLDMTFNLKSKISVILNITEDHINRYPYGFEQYKKSKLSIYNKSEICIFNSEDKLNIPLNINKKNWISFGTNKKHYNIFYKKKTFLCYQDEIIIDTDQLSIHGYHNYLNILACLAISDAMKFPRKSIIKEIISFKGLPHRLQLIHNNNGIKWINDSKSTNVHSTISAINSIHTPGVIWLLLGGDSKSSNFNILKKYLIEQSVKIYCFGKDGFILSQLYKKKSTYVKTLQKSLFLISKLVKPGDIVLLSPGCSSLDQFINFEERGDIFTKLAKEIG